MKKIFPLALALAAIRLLAADQAAFKAELIRAENDFCRQAAEQGIPAAFAAHMAEEVFMPNDGTLTKADWVAVNPTAPDRKTALRWSPLLVDVSADGTLGYTWGKYEIDGTGPDGQPRHGEGIYLTIWKRQPDGSWKFVFDGGPRVSPEALKKILAHPGLLSPEQK